LSKFSVKGVDAGAVRVVVANPFTAAPCGAVTATTAPPPPSEGWPINKAMPPANIATPATPPSIVNTAAPVTCLREATSVATPSTAAAVTTAVAVAATCETCRSTLEKRNRMVPIEASAPTGIRIGRRRSSRGRFGSLTG
jgi:hypothetical protein